jgi:hypothetical protein
MSATLTSFQDMYQLHDISSVDIQPHYQPALKKSLEILLSLHIHFSPRLPLSAQPYSPTPT